MTDNERLRAWWWHAQGLDGRLQGRPPSAILADAGWARSVGGVCPYLTLRSRGGTGRSEADRAVEATDIHELPCARGCTYVVGARDYALALKVAQPFREAERRTARRLGVSDDELETLCREVLAVLADGPLHPTEMRRALGGAVRSLGEAGKRKGLATTLPPALGHLQVHGEIRRISTTGRLDGQRYRYAVWDPNPLSDFDLTLEEAHAELGRRYFEWAGPATVNEFRRFSGLGARAARAAVSPIDLAPIGGDRLVPAHLREAFEDCSVPETPRVSLVSSLDAVALLRRDAGSLVATHDRDHPLLATSPNALTDLPYHAIVDRGTLAGFWEFDTATRSVVWATFRDPAPETIEAIARAQRFVDSELQDARSFSLDSPKRRAPRIAALRAFQGPALRQDRMPANVSRHPITHAS